MTVVKARSIILTPIMDKKSGSKQSYGILVRLPIPLPPELHDVKVRQGEIVNIPSLSFINDSKDDIHDALIHVSSSSTLINEFKITITRPLAKRGTTCVLTKDTKCILETQPNMTISELIQLFLPGCELKFDNFYPHVSKKDHLGVPYGIVEISLINHDVLELTRDLRTTTTLIKISDQQIDWARSLIELLSNDSESVNLIPSNDKEVVLTVQEARQRDVGRGKIRIDDISMRLIDITTGDVVEIEGRKVTGAIAWPSYPEDQGAQIIRMDGVIRENARVSLGEKVKVRKAQVKVAKTVIIASTKRQSLEHGFDTFVKRKLLGMPVTAGDTVLIPILGRASPFIVTKTNPNGIVLITDTTKVIVETEIEIDLPATKVLLRDRVKKFYKQLKKLKMNESINSSLLEEALYHFILDNSRKEDVNKLIKSEKRSRYFFIILSRLINSICTSQRGHESLSFDVMTDVHGNDPFIPLLIYHHIIKTIPRLFFQELSNETTRYQKKIELELILNKLAELKNLDASWLEELVELMTNDLKDVTTILDKVMLSELEDDWTRIELKYRRLEEKLSQLQAFLGEVTSWTWLDPSSFQFNNSWSKMAKLPDNSLVNQESLDDDVIESNQMRVFLTVFNPALRGHIPYIRFYLRSNPHLHLPRLRKFLRLTLILSSLSEMTSEWQELVCQVRRTLQEHEKIYKEFFETMKNSMHSHDILTNGKLRILQVSDSLISCAVTWDQDCPLAFLIDITPKDAVIKAALNCSSCKKSQEDDDLRSLLNDAFVPCIRPIKDEKSIKTFGTNLTPKHGLAIGKFIVLLNHATALTLINTNRSIPKELAEMLDDTIISQLKDKFGSKCPHRSWSLPSNP